MTIYFSIYLFFILATLFLKFYWKDLMVLTLLRSKKIQLSDNLIYKMLYMHVLACDNVISMNLRMHMDACVCMCVWCVCVIVHAIHLCVCICLLVFMDVGESQSEMYEEAIISKARETEFKTSFIEFKHLLLFHLMSSTAHSIHDVCHVDSILKGCILKNT